MAAWEAHERDEIIRDLVWIIGSIYPANPQIIPDPLPEEYVRAAIWSEEHIS